MEIDKKFQDLEIGLVSRLRELRQAVQLTKSLDKEILQLKKQIKETEFFDSGCKSGDFIFEKDKQITPEEKNQPGDGQNNQNIENSSVENIIRDKKLDLMRLSDILDTNIQKRDLIFERLVRLVDAHERRIADRLSDINLNLLNNNNRSKDWIPKKEQAISLVSKVRDRVEHLSLQFWDDFGKQ